MVPGSQSVNPKWTFLTNHSHVLICVWRNPFVRARDIADLVGITERSVQRILKELTEAGVIVTQKDGRRNRYSIDEGRKLRHPLEGHCSVGDLLNLISACNADK